MRNRTEKDVESLIRNSTFPNQGHKDRLRRTLLEPVIELDPDDLTAAAGGVGTSVPDNDDVWISLPDIDKKSQL